MDKGKIGDWVVEDPQQLNAKFEYNSGVSN